MTSVTTTPEMGQGVDLCGWTGSGPLPTPELEQGAWALFMLDHADWQWDRVTSATRDDYRKRYLTIRSRVLKAERWTLFTAAEKLTDVSCQLVYGDRLLGSTIRSQVKDFAESYLEDLARLFPRKLFYPRDVDANLAELKAEGRLQ